MMVCNATGDSQARGRQIRHRRGPGHHGAETTTAGGRRLEEEQEGLTSLFFQGGQGLLATPRSSWQHLPYFLSCRFRKSLCVLRASLCICRLMMYVHLCASCQPICYYE